MATTLAQPAIAPAFWADAKRRLSAADPLLAAIIYCHPRIAPINLGNAFRTLARSIVGQQISVKAADSVWARVQAACIELSPRSVLRRDPTILRGCGLSQRKVEYLQDLAGHFVDRRVDEASLAQMADEDVIATLTDIRGIGRWTAEMFLIFNLLRPNILPLDDLGLLKGISVNYFSGEPVSRSDAREVSANWEPWRTVATWYLWRSLDPVTID